MKLKIECTIDVEKANASGMFDSFSFSLGNIANMRSGQKLDFIEEFSVKVIDI